VSVVTRAARFGFCNRQTYLRDANRETLLSVQLETREAAENAEAIAAVPGVDLVFIGPADLAQSLGHPAESITAPTVRVIEDIIRRVAPLKPIGVSAFSAADAQRWQRAGATWILCSSAGPLKEAFVSHATTLRGAVTGPASDAAKPHGGAGTGKRAGLPRAVLRRKK
jgi:2-keto-3-deoxy-L-rhamnonate aldolase RhmA